MTRGRHQLKILFSIGLAALGLMAFGATAAQGDFLILGVTLEQLKLEVETFSGHVDEPFSFLVASANFEINCPVVEVNGALLLTDGDAQFSFQECLIDTMEPLEKLKGCHVVKETINLDALLLVVLHKVKEGQEEKILTFLLAEPLLGAGGFGLIRLTENPECPLAEVFNVTGSIAFAINQTDAVVNLIKAGPEELQLLLGDKLMVGKKEALLDGSFFAELTGFYHGCKWGAI